MASPEDKIVPHNDPRIEIIPPQSKLSAREFVAYARHLIRAAFQGFELLPDMLIGTVIALLTYILQVGFSVIPLEDWTSSRKWRWIASFVLPYVVVLSGDALRRLALAPARVHKALMLTHRAEVQEHEAQIEKLQDRIQYYETMTPYFSTINIVEIQREIIGAPPHASEMKNDIFLKLQLYLSTPRKLTDVAYRLELDFNGLKHFPQLRNDIDEWEMNLKSGSSGTVRITAFPLSALATTMESDRPI